ncbi:MAG TPA: phosphodiester glycosidase family protein [Anaerolineales bacterium]|jgi:hypothetical protein
MQWIKRRRLIGLAGLLIVLAALVGYALYNNGRPAPVTMKRQLFPGVTYRRVVRYLPRFMIVHLLEIDTRSRGLEFFVTKPDRPNAGAPLDARTTSAFLQEFGARIAINGDGFQPWWSRSPADYYPHPGDPVTPNGFTASYGEIYARGAADETAEPTLYISRRNELTFNKIPGRVFHAISGDRMLVLQGEPISDLNREELDPRTAIGTNKNGRWVYLVVIDGRQPFYSEGASLAELADLMVDFGAYFAMNLDGGGSSTLVIAGQNGEPVILNSPIDSYIPGRERPVADHLGIYVPTAEK